MKRYVVLPTTFKALCHSTYYSGNTLHMHAHIHLVLIKTMREIRHCNRIG